MSRMEVDHNDMTLRQINQTRSKKCLVSWLKIILPISASSFSSKFMLKSQERTATCEHNGC
uniref:Uncharacterized protein n=2 Tax=Arion vulgaris TaxID=1028688 RepID=A0A0B7A9H2_9EUPU